MHKIYFLLLFVSSSLLYSQSNTFYKDKANFADDSLTISSSIFKDRLLSFDYKEQSKAYSIYNPKPGLNSFKIVPQNYYSLENTNRLLGNEMKNVEKEPIYPEMKKQTFGEAVFSGIIDSIFDK